MLPTPAEVAEGISEVDEILQELAVEIRLLASHAARAEASFKVEFAKARISARYEAEKNGGRLTTDAAEDIATVATEKLRLDHLLQTNAVMAAREALRAAGHRMDGYRTQATSIRAGGG
jgi:hypothetical protein